MGAKRHAISGPSRRALVAGALGAAGLAGAGLGARPAQAATRLGDDGLYTQDWYVEGFLDLQEDLAAATAKGHGFALQWSQRGCPLCKRLHTEYFADAAIEGPIKAAFDIVHLDLFGAREVTFFDGARLSEKALGTREGIRATPTFQFFAEVDGKVKEVARMPGLLAPPEFAAMFRYVAQKGYAGASFPEWLARQSAPRG